MFFLTLITTTMLRAEPLIGKCHWRSIPRIVKGRKDYRCCECNALLGKGSKHQYVSGVWGNSNLEFRTCPECLDRWEDLIAANPDFDFTPFNHGDLNEAISYLEFQAAIDSLDCDRVAKAIRRSQALDELVAETERLGLYELSR